MEQYELAFRLINLGVMPGWLLLALAPRWSGTRIVVHGSILILIFCALYVTWLGWALVGGENNPEGSMGSLSGVMALFAHPMGILVGWTHYLAFDLFVGAWIGRDAIRRDVSHWLVVPSLFLTLMFGPVGLALYLILRAVTGKGGLALEEGAASGKP
ncbi:DUF4281 domain-containing protein [Parvularcula flava]|nr:DUF4281 domain-containing protein [Aquisalinus luteolus]